MGAFLSKNIVFLSKGEHSPSTRYRALNYFSSFEAEGWAPVHLSLKGGLLQQAKILLHARNAHAVVIIRRSLGFPFLFLLKSVTNTLIFDLDDSVFLKSSGKPSNRRNRRFRSTLKYCKQVWAGNDYLKSNTQDLVGDASVLPTAIDLARYQIESVKSSKYIDLVWIGSSSTSKYLIDIIPTLEKAVEQTPNLRLKIIADFTLESSVLNIVSIPWNLDTEVSELMASDIGIAPMRDDPWTKGKCALKVLQYMACKLPVISSSVGANKDIVKQDQTGLLAESENDWLEAIVRLSSSIEERESFGRKGYAACVEGFSQEVCFSKMIKQLSSIL